MPGRGLWKIIVPVVVVGVLVLAALGTLMYGAVQARDRYTIFPNVTIGGVDVSGMTQDQAESALQRAGLSGEFADVAATVVFPDKSELTITARDAKLKMDPDQAIRDAYEYGRDGSFMQNGISYLKSMRSHRDIPLDATASVDENAVRALVKTFTETYNAGLNDDAYTVEKDFIVIVKGAGGGIASVDDATAVALNALNESIHTGKPVTAAYEIPADSRGELDLKAIYDQIFVEPKNPGFSDGAITEGVTGVSFDLAAAEKLVKSAQVGETVRIPLIRKEPEMKPEDLQALLFRDVLSECTTYIHGTWNRWNNINLASAAINGTVLNPGDVFSFNEVVGERTYDKGYADATAYVGGRSVPDVGGGICQVTSTLYACVLYADLEEVQRENHMFEVEYHMLGIDATVAWPDVDYKFRNSSDYPIKIEAFVDGDYITMRLHGTKTNDNYVKLDYEVISVTDFDTIRRPDPSVPAGETRVDTYGHTGYVVDTYKYIYNGDGELIDSYRIARNVYDKCDYVVLVPVDDAPAPTESTPPSPEPTNDPEPTEDPSPSPTEDPSPSPTEEPSPSPTEEPSPSPTEEPSPSPTEEPSPSPTEEPGPTEEPSPEIPDIPIDIIG